MISMVNIALNDAYQGLRMVINEWSWLGLNGEYMFMRVFPGTHTG